MSVSATMILDQIKHAAPASCPVVDVLVKRHLARLAADLLVASPDAVEEYARYLQTTKRGIEVPSAAVSERITGQRVVVTGATGCIGDRKSTRLNSSHANISYAVFCLKKKK